MVRWSTFPSCLLLVLALGAGARAQVVRVVHETQDDMAFGAAEPDVHGANFLFVARVSPDSFDADSNFVGIADRDVLLVELDGSSPLVISGKAPTTLTWLEDPLATGYDVIRGNLAALEVAGDAVTLGDVLCLRDDSTSSDTYGFEDYEDPEPGQGFFYLYRKASAASPGSYGNASSGFERIAASGDCALGP